MEGKRTWWTAGALAALAVLVAVAAWGWRGGGRTTPANDQGSNAKQQEDLPPNAITSTWVKAHWLNGVQGTDVRTWDFTRLSLSDLQFLSFDSKTQWPDQSHLPAGFQPDAALKAAEDPGLGLGDLHRQGVTGKGISVAMIDLNMLPEHRELAGRIKYIDAFPDVKNGRAPHFHGMATASILAGANVGVAPDAFLYYFAVPDDSNGFKNVLTALDQILAFNTTLPQAQKIRIVSVSAGPSGEDDKTQWSGLVAKARAQGVEVVYSDTRPLVNYSCAGVLPRRDRNDPNAYDWASWLLDKNPNFRSQIGKVTLGVPADFRTTASVASPDAYVYWGQSGQSWAIPYAAGLLTLGLQVNPDATFDQLWRALDETATVNAQNVRMVNPAAYIDAVRR